MIEYHFDFLSYRENDEMSADADADLFYQFLFQFLFMYCKCSFCYLFGPLGLYQAII